MAAKKKRLLFAKLKGFTLVELLVIISIIAILAAVGMTFYGQAEKVARDSKRKSDLMEIRKALELYYAAKRSYPSSLSGISNGTYFPSGSVPTDPNNTDPYVYKYYPPQSVVCKKFILCGKLEISADNNRGTLPTSGSDPCATPVTDSGTQYYCIGSIQN